MNAQAALGADVLRAYKASWRDVFLSEQPGGEPEALCIECRQTFLDFLGSGLSLSLSFLAALSFSFFAAPTPLGGRLASLPLSLLTSKAPSPASSFSSLVSSPLLCSLTSFACETNPSVCQRSIRAVFETLSWAPCDLRIASKSAGVSMALFSKSLPVINCRHA